MRGVCEVSFVWRLSQAGYNWSDGYDRRIISEDCPLWKIALQGSFAIVTTPGSAQTTLTIAHNLGYKPEFRVASQSLDLNGNFLSTYRQHSWSDFMGVGAYARYMSYPDTINLNIVIDTTALYTLGYTFHGFYQIFYHPIL